jgi:hypothetical protein
MDHFKQTESFMDLLDFDSGILGGSEEDPLQGSFIQRQFSDCAGGSCQLGGNGSSYQTGSGVLNNTTPMQTEHFGNPGINGSGGYGGGGIGGMNQQQVRMGFGRNPGNLPGRPILNQFNPQTGPSYSQNYNPYPTHQTHRQNPEHPQLPQIPLPNQLQYQGPQVPQVQFSRPQMPHRNTAPPEPPQHTQYPQYTEQFTMPNEFPPGMPWVPGIIVALFIAMLYYTPEFSDYLSL